MREALLHYAIVNWRLNTNSVLDLACGSGKITEVLVEEGWTQNVEGADIFAGAVEQYRRERGKECVVCSFEDVAEGKFPPKKYSLVVCSFGLHFLDRKWLPDFMKGLRRLTDSFLVIGPVGEPEVPTTCWRLVREEIMNFHHARLFRSNVAMI